MEKPL